MEEREFDKFADEYYNIHLKHISISGETPEFFAEYKIRDVAARFKANSQSVKRILDFGSGVGNSIPYFRKYFPAATITCADVSQRSLEVSQLRYPGAEDYVHIDGKTLLLPDNQFDIAFSACVFHHIDHVEHEFWLSELNRVVRPYGKIFIFEHNPLNPLTRAVVRSCEFDENAHLISGWAFSKRLSRAHWSNIRVRYRIFFPHALSALRKLEPYLQSIPLGAQYYVSGQKMA